MNKMQLKFLSRSENEVFARNVVAAFALPLEPTLSELSDVKTAVSEAVTNCIVHAYRDTIGMIYITAKYDGHGTLQIKIRDKGCGIADVEQAMQPLFTTAGEERAGLGFAVMESFMGKLRVTSKLGSGTTVTMQKNLARRVMKNG